MEVQGAARRSRSLRGGTRHRPPGDGLQGAGDRRAHTGDRPDHARPDLRGESRYTEGRRRDDPRGQGLPEAAGEKAACAQRACPLAAGSVFLPSGMTSRSWPWLCGDPVWPVSDKPVGVLTGHGRRERLPRREVQTGRWKLKASPRKRYVPAVPFRRSTPVRVGLPGRGPLSPCPRGQIKYPEGGEILVWGPAWLERETVKFFEPGTGDHGTSPRTPVGRDPGGSGDLSPLAASGRGRLGGGSRGIRPP